MNLWNAQLHLAIKTCEFTTKHLHMWKWMDLSAQHANYQRVNSDCIWLRVFHGQIYMTQHVRTFLTHRVIYTDFYIHSNYDGMQCFTHSSLVKCSCKRAATSTACPLFCSKEYVFAIVVVIVASAYTHIFINVVSFIDCFFTFHWDIYHYLSLLLYLIFPINSSGFGKEALINYLRCSRNIATKNFPTFLDGILRCRLPSEIHQIWGFTYRSQSIAQFRRSTRFGRVGLFRIT